MDPDPLADIRESVAVAPAEAIGRLDAAIPGLSGVDLAHAYQLRTRALRALGRHAEALADFDAAAEAADTAGDPLLAAQVRIGAVDTLGMLGRYDEAAPLASTLADTLRAGNATTDAAKVLGNRGSLFLRQDRYEDALAAYAEADALLTENDDLLLRATLAMNRAIALTYLGRAEEALDAYRYARPLFEDRGRTFEAAVTGSNIGFLHYTAGRYAAALAELTAAYRVFVASGRPHEAARCDLDTGDVYRALNLVGEAQVCYARALTIFESLPLEDDYARAHLGLAALAVEESRFAEAGHALDRAEAHFAARNNTVALAHVALRRADLLLREGQNEMAVAVADGAERAFTDSGLTGWAAEARLLASLARPDTPVETFEAVAETAQQTARGWLECRVEVAIGRLMRSQGNREGALAHLRRAVDVLESVRTQIAPESLHLAFLSDKEDVYSELVSLLLDGTPTTDELSEAFTVVERSRSRLLLERLLSAQSPETGAGSDNAWRERLAELRAQLSRAYYDALSLSPEDASRHGIRLAERSLAPLEAAYAGILREAELDGTLPETTLRLTPPNLPTLQAALAPGETLVLYAPVNEALAAFVLQCDRFTVRPAIAAWSEVVYACRRFRYHLQKMVAPPDLRAAVTEELIAEMNGVLERLYNLLVRPLTDLLAGERIVIVPCGPLYGIPFHALKDGGDYLLDRADLLYAPSAAVWHTLCRQNDRVGPGAENALLVGVPGLGTEFVAAELEGIARQMPATVLCGNSATVGNVRQAAPHAARIHLATHALFRRDNPLFSGLQLSDDWLLGRDLYGMRLNADLVTLSACDTGAARIAPGEEWMGLARGFLAAGARRVVVSLWPADDAATADLMVGFYKRLQCGMAPSQALRAAQREMAALRPHPYYWAAFCQVGRR